MVEIRIADELDLPFCERSNKLVRIHVSLEHSLEDLVEAIGGLLTSLEIQYLRDIWSNDAAARSYQRLEDGSYLIRLKEGSNREAIANATISFSQLLL